MRGRKLIGSVSGKTLTNINPSEEPNDVWAALSALHSKRAAGRSVRGNNREGVHNFRDLQADSQQESDSSLRQEVTLGNRAAGSREVVEGSEESGESGEPYSGQNPTGD